MEFEGNHMVFSEQLVLNYLFHYNEKKNINILMIWNIVFV